MQKEQPFGKFGYLSKVKILIKILFYKNFRCRGSGMIFKQQVGCFFCGGVNKSPGTGLVSDEKAKNFRSNKNRFLCFWKSAIYWILQKELFASLEKNLFCLSVVRALCAKFPSHFRICSITPYSVKPIWWVSTKVVISSVTIIVFMRRLWIPGLTGPSRYSWSQEIFVTI